MFSGRVLGKDPARLNNGLDNCVVLCRYTVYPITLSGEGIRRQRYSPGLLGKQSLKVQRIALDVKVRDRCQVLQMAGRVFCLSAFPNAVVSELLQCRLLSYSAFQNLCCVNLTRRSHFKPLFKKTNQLRLIARDTRQAMRKM